MSLSLVVFYFLSVVCLGGAMGVVVARNVVHAALLLLVSLMGVAGLYLLLLAEFLALVQVLIYGGAITIVVLFVIMLTRVQEFRSMRGNPQWPLAIVASLGVFVLLAAAMIKSAPTETTRRVPDDIRQLVNHFEQTGEVLPIDNFPELAKAGA